MTALIQYDAACRALAQAATVDEVMAIRDESERMRLYARQAKDRDLLAHAAVINKRAERQLGVILSRAKEAGQISRGRPKNNCHDDGHLSRVKLEEVGIDRNLSYRAQRAASISERAFEAMVTDMRERIISGAAKLIDREGATEEKKQRRANKEASLGMMQAALPNKKYGVILADPEWRFEPYSRETGMDRAPENHYPTSSLGDIMSRDVRSLAAKDCVLFLWATAPMLPQALMVMNAWNFAYKTHLIWAKDKIGTGYWARNAHELLLIGTHGNIPAPAPGTQPSSVIGARVGAHSAKPERFLDLIETLFPTLPKIELNRRGPTRPGWDAWGNESLPPHDPETGEIIETGEANHNDSLATEPAPSQTPIGGAGAPDPYEIPEYLRRTNP